MEYNTGSTLATKIRKGICQVRGCSNQKGRHRKCRVCQRKTDKENNPISYAYSILKQNAKRRGKVFTISVEYFREWCIKENYIELKGRYKGCMTIDRDKDELGYEPGNLKIMEHSENVRKRFADQRKRLAAPSIDISDIVRRQVPINEDVDLPF